MCPGTESRGIINGCDPLIPKDGCREEHHYHEDTMRSSPPRGEEGGGSGGTFIQAFLQRLLPANSPLRTLPLSEVPYSA